MKRPALYTQSSEEISRAIAPRGTWSRTSNPGPPVPPTLARETGDPLRAEIFYSPLSAVTLRAPGSRKFSISLPATTLNESLKGPER